MSNRINNNHAGSKAILDIEKYLNELGFNRLCICNIEDNKLLRTIRLFLNLRKIFFFKKALVIVQYPTLGKLTDKIISTFYIPLLNKNKCETIAIIHDLECMRFSVNNAQYKKDDLNFLKSFNHIICHNNKMLAWLRQQGLTNNIVSLELFDYMADRNIDNDFRKNDKTIAFPGNLDAKKSGFIYRMDQLCLNDINISLYGPNYKSNLLNSKNITYKGIVKPEDLPNKILESFGLIWDGPELYSCKGCTGEYMKLNNPHKLSLYMASGVPVIVWKDAAVAEFVLENNVGIVINSLEDLDNELNKITNEKYKEFLENTRRIQSKVLSGYYIKNSLDKIIKKVKG